MIKYIIIIDMGGSNTKSIIMKMHTDKAELVDMYLFNTIDLKNDEENIKKFIEKNNIDFKDIEKIVLVGSRSSYYDDLYLNIPIIKINEFDAIGMGGTILSNNREAIIVNIGTGTTIVYSNINESKYLIGTGLGGGCFYGISKRFGLNFNTIDDLLNLANNGNYHNVDLLIKDISKNDISLLTMEVTAANFAAYNKVATEKDIVNGILNMITQNIGLIVKLAKENFCLTHNKKDIDIVFTGNFVTNQIVKNSLSIIEKFTDQKYNYIDNKFSPYATAIGAYEYYLIKMREDKSIES